MSDQFPEDRGVTADGITRDMARAAAKRAAAVAADRGDTYTPEPEVAPAVKARRQTTR